MHSHAQGLFGTSETVRGAQVYQSHWYHAGGREGMLMLPYGHSDRFRGHSFTQQTFVEYLLHVKHTIHRGRYKT